MENWIGKTLYFYCAGYFGSQSYTDKVIEAIGKDWVVAREVESNEVVLASFYDKEHMEEKLLEWSVKPSNKKEEMHDEEDEGEDLSDMITKEYLLEKIKIRQDKTGYKNTDEFKEAVENGIVKEYSAAWLGMWKHEEKLLKKREEEEKENR